MVRGKAILSAVAAILLVLGGARPAWADAIGLFKTGNAETDLDPTKDPRVVVVLDNGGKANDVAQQDYITSGGGTTGWNFKDFRFRYDKDSDTLGVAINFFGIAGDVDGDNNPGVGSNNTLQRGGVDLAKLGGQESIAVAFYNDNASDPVLFAGVPADKSQAGPGIDGFTVADPKAQARAANFGIERSFGTINTTHLGALALDPSAEHPDFEFTVKNFSKIPGLKIDDKGNFRFGFRAYAGNIDDVVAGEDLFKTEASITVPREQVVPDPSPVPEPATLLAWTVFGGLALGLRLRARGR